jgi:uncharacterized membrane protein HdeD (DUF308 family)
LATLFAKRADARLKSAESLFGKGLFMLELLARRWWIVLIRGICALVLGVLAILWPYKTLNALLFVFGAFTVGDGLTAVWLGFSTPHNGRLWWEMVILGLIAIVAGIVVAFWPVFVAEIFVLLIAAAAIVRGVFEITTAIQLRKVIDDEWLLVLSGVMSLLFGILFFTYPREGVLALMLLSGALMIVDGGMMTALALRLLHLHRHMGPHAASASPLEPAPLPR